MDQNMGALSPFVYWGQTNGTISLKIDLKNVKCPLIDLNERTLNFLGTGIGAKGLHEYAFLIEFYSSVEPKESFYKVNDRHIEFVLKKKENILWPRLLESLVRPVWVKVDFDKIENEDSDQDTSQAVVDDFDDFTPNQQNSYRNFGQKDFGRGRKSMKKGFHSYFNNTVEDFKKTYLLLYNLFQFVGFVYVLLIFTIRYIKDGSQSTEDAYSAVGKVIKFLHLMQILEILHPLMGYTSGSALMPSLQLSGRCFLIFVMIGSEPRIQTNPSVFYLFMAYTLVEIIRYPYYMLHVFNVNLKLLTWMRYSVWIILYPIGFIAEAVVIYQNIPYFEESGKFSLYLPNCFNFSFHLPTLLRLYLLIGLFPALYFMMNHMYRQRIKVLNTKTFKRRLIKQS